MRTSLKVDVWAGTQSRRHTTIHECNKSARLFQETHADKQCLSSTIRGRKSAALFAHSSTVTNGIVPNFCSHACHIFQHAPSPPESLSCIFHVLCFLSPAETARGTPWRLSTEGNPRGLSLLPSSVLKTFFFFFPQTLAWSRHTSDRADTRGREQEGKLWYRVAMATTQNGMRSPWQQTWRGEFSGDGGCGGSGGACAGLWSFGRPHHSTDSYLTAGNLKPKPSKIKPFLSGFVYNDDVYHN